MSDNVIPENGMSSMLCDICNMYPEVRTKICNLFTKYIESDESQKFKIVNEGDVQSENEKKIDYMWFTGYYDAGSNYGRPDITIRFNDGSFFFIEVKTRNKTDLQENQELGIRDRKGKRQGYIGLIDEYLNQNVNSSYAFLVDKGHPGFDGKTKKIGQKILKPNNEEDFEFTVPVVTWSEVLKELESLDGSLKIHIREKNSCITLFVKQVQNNVDGIDDIEGVNNSSLEVIETTKNCYDLIHKFQELENLSFVNPEDINKNAIGVDFIFKFEFKKCRISPPQFGWGIQLIMSSAEEKYNKIYPEDWVWIGINPYLFENRNIKFPEKDKNSASLPSIFLFSLAIHGHLLSRMKLDKKMKAGTDYCVDNSYYFYFPLGNEEVDKNNLNNAVQKKLKYIFNEFIPDEIQHSLLTWTKVAKDVQEN